MSGIKNQDPNFIGSDDLKANIVSDLHMETAKIPWQELQRFFAGGKLLLLDSDQDMLEVAASLIANDVQRLQELIDKGLLVHPSDEQAKQWVVEDAMLWAVVLNPWVLVQENCK